MYAYVINNFSEQPAFEKVNVEKPLVKPGYVLIKVMATSVNPIDVKLRRGMFPDITMNFPAILHGDVAGIVQEIEPSVTKFKKGDLVFGCVGGVKGEGGALAEYILADANLLAKIPANLDMRQAAALPLVALTVWEGLFEKVKIKPKQKILIHGGAGGVGHLAIQLAKWAGAIVFATVSNKNKAKIAQSLGATETINYRNEAVEDYVNRLTGGHGFDIVFDTIGGENIDRSIKAVSQYGQVVTILSQSTHDLSGLMQKSANLHVVFMLIPLLCNIQRERHGNILNKIANLAEQGIIAPLLDPRQFSFSEVNFAHQHMQSGKALGKVVINH